MREALAPVFGIRQLIGYRPGDGQSIHFSSDRGARREMCRVPATGGQPGQVTQTGRGFRGVKARRRSQRRVPTGSR